MKRAIMGASAAAVVALAPFCISPAPAHADDPCVGVTDPAAHQACMDDPMHGYQMGEGECQSSPDRGQLGSFCRDLWVRKFVLPGESATL
jgi:hypothetical protein